MRYALKGGIWKNVEDEILKAAVMKYGLNQWSRISSLLVRKSAKQCKARWYEWIDPSIKKTEWSREEEEVLLHLAKIFPCQWRTIAPMVGRTPNQCVEHYEKLLDTAQGKIDIEDDPRKLKPGEIDPCPENKPAKPDPVDMDEDMKEMLAEARVRLANTKGKKAKRKARGKQIEEARRLVQLQKEREMKMAGIEIIPEIKKKKKVRLVNYNIEVPFERVAPEYVFKNGVEENQQPNINLGKVSLATLEGKLRVVEDEKFRKVDEKRLKKLKERDLETAVHRQININNQIQDPNSKLSLPAPQLQDRDLEVISKLAQYSNPNSLSTQTATKQLIQYSQLHSQLQTPTPVRTPRLNNSILREAINNYNLQNVQTPLVGGQNQTLDQSDFKGITPQQQVQSTPNIYKNLLIQQTPQHNVQQSVNQTPQPHKTPIVDNLKINEIDRNWETSSQSEIMSQQENKQLQQKKQSLIDQLKQISQPKNDYQIEIPELEDLPQEKQLVLDSEDVQKLKKQRLQQKLYNQSLLQSKAIQKNLPRPITINEKLERKNEIDQMIQKEMMKLLINDYQNHPQSTSNKQNFDVQNLEQFSLNQLQNADQLIQQEIQSMKIVQHTQEEYLEKWNKAKKNIIFDQQNKTYVHRSQLKENQIKQIFQSQFSEQQAYLEKEMTQNSKIKTNLQIQFGGYIKREQKQQNQKSLIEDNISQLQMEQEVFKTLKQQESQSILVRSHENQSYLKRLESKESELQLKYQELQNLKEELLKEDQLIQN